jgi:hypothetical protein
MAISGDNFQKSQTQNNYSYYFSSYNHVWGWASWRRAWKLYDRDMVSWSEAKNLNIFNNNGGNDCFVKYWTKIFDNYTAGKIDTWDYPWTYSCWIQSGLTILPNVNLVSNIGFGDDATHTKIKTSKHSALPVYPMMFPLKHPLFIVRDMQADAFTERNAFGIKMPQRSWLVHLIEDMKKKLCS